MSEQFLKSCADALQREHGPAAMEIIERQIAGLRVSNPKAAMTWRMIGKHLMH